MTRTRTRHRSRHQAVAHHNRQAAGVTGVLLGLVCLYTVVIGPDPALWLAWAVLLLACAALFLIR